MLVGAGPASAHVEATAEGAQAGTGPFTAGDDDGAHFVQRSRFRRHEPPAPAETEPDEAAQSSTQDDGTFPGGLVAVIALVPAALAGRRGSEDHAARGMCERDTNTGRRRSLTARAGMIATWAESGICVQSADRIGLRGIA